MSYAGRTHQEYFQHETYIVCRLSEDTEKNHMLIMVENDKTNDYEKKY